MVVYARSARPRFIFSGNDSLPSGIYRATHGWFKINYYFAHTFFGKTGIKTTGYGYTKA